MGDFTNATPALFTFQASILCVNLGTQGTVKKMTTMIGIQTYDQQRSMQATALQQLTTYIPNIYQ